MSQFVLYSLDYHDSLHEYYQKLVHLPGFVLLESTDRAYGRYDIISAYPYDFIQINQNAEDLPGLLKKISQLLSPIPSVADLPFQGGALGYISYDLGAKLLGIDSCIQPTLENMPLLDLGLYDWAIIVDHHDKTVTVFAANTHQSTTKIVDEVLALWNNPTKQQHNAAIKGDFTPLMSKQNYIKAFSSVYQFLKEGRSYQVNLTQPFHVAYEGDSWTFYKKICLKNPVPFAAFLRTAHADILSFSPERFLFHEEGKLVTSPIKGTIGRSTSHMEDEELKNKLTSCEKNRAENVMIVDLLRNDLGKIAQPGSVHVTSLCEVQSYNSVHHLVSTIEAQCLATVPPFDAFLSCFPGGSITGAPKIESMRIIHEQESYARGIYCGSIGYFSRHGRFDTNIAIRTVTAKENMLHLAAGGGIVIDSNWEDEYRECFIKIAAVINGLK
ncbi:aminodeoxychorismate synthase component I [Legionella anisa]|uniref:aminodeoxychorismate synthase n=1 Tax=Legionella anisa TaxID=28082 RepID=A0AAX0WYA9_9GAMM|nr:aminodeoxychorismate synthase component I [Legionella anisa]AWN74225.1 aminodeoxychorismate synthase component I [Legionella anisa]KTC72111.1 para-aminobenzoate synthase, component I [Legionella anisa]MBN5934334.1 aminodeoxychorismate synthase component I [Legionella anisa]MCW8425743.1 aminodeoxychorismate synthase component I [Legionella anisa]MCW8448827.1 aminodeoxychorismate synthase component I [Legionella anisa]